MKEENSIYLLIKDYFKVNRHNWIEVSHNPEYDEKFTNKWLQVALFFEKDANIIITDYNKFLLAKHKSYISEGERWRHYPILLAMGEFLIDHSIVESLEIIYEILNKMIERDKWELKDKEKLTFKNKYRDELHHSIKLENPFIIILKLKYEESKIRGKEYFENFLNKNSTYKIIFNNSTLSENFRIYFSNNLSEDDIIKLMGVGFTLQYSYSGHYKRIKNRAFLYQNLYDKFGYDKEKIWVLCKGMHRVHENLTRKAKKMQWEYAFFDLAIQLDKEYKDLMKARPLSDSITNLFEFYANHSNFIDESGRRIFFDFSGFLSFLIEEIKPYTFLYTWFQITIFEYFKQSNYMFNDIKDQIRIIGRIYKCFKEINHDLVKWVIKNAKENYFIQEIGYWSLSSTIYDILEVLEILKYDHTNFYEETRNYFIDKVKILGFRLYPRKDWQLYNLIYIMKNIIHYFPQEDSNIINKIHRICDMFNIADEITERSEIFEVKKKFHDILLTWNQNLAKNVYYILGINRYNPRELISDERKEEFKVPKTFINEISELLRNPSKFIDRIDTFHEEIREKELFEQKEYSVNILKILAELDELDNVTFAEWEELFEYLINQGKDKSIKEISDSFFVESFIEFYNNKIKAMKFERSVIKELEIKIEKALLKSPKDEFPFVSIEKLYNLDKQESFDYGWEVLYNQFVNRRKKIIHYIPYDFIIYTFLSKINKTNFENFLNIFFTYLKRLFRLMECF